MSFIRMYGRFFMQVLVSLALLGIGTALIFAAKEGDDKSIGVGFIGTVFGAWVNIKSVKSKEVDSDEPLEEVVEDTPKKEGDKGKEVDNLL